MFALNEYVLSPQLLNQKLNQATELVTETLEAYRIHSLLAENYSDSILDYQHARQLLTDEAWAWATSYDQKKQLGLNKPEQFAILVHDNYTELLYFDSTETRDNFVLQMQN